VISKSEGSDINDLYNKLKPFGIMQFVRSGRISVSKEKMQISLLLEELKINKKIRQWQIISISLPLRLQLEQLGVCEFMDQSEFADGIKALKGKVVIVGCGAQGLNQGLNMREGLDISYALRAEAIPASTNAADNGFTVGTYEDLIPTADFL
jgi:hypothetical protein